jgi:hypothetical protein
MFIALAGAAVGISATASMSDNVFVLQGRDWTLMNLSKTP